MPIVKGGHVQVPPMSSVLHPEKYLKMPPKEGNALNVLYDDDHHDTEMIKQFKYLADYVPRRLLTLSHTTKPISKMELEELTDLVILLGDHNKFMTKKKCKHAHSIISDMYKKKDVVVDPFYSANRLSLKYPLGSRLQIRQVVANNYDVLYLDIYTLRRNLETHGSPKSALKKAASFINQYTQARFKRDYVDFIDYLNFLVENRIFRARDLYDPKKAVDVSVLKDGHDVFTALGFTKQPFELPKGVMSISPLKFEPSSADPKSGPLSLQVSPVLRLSLSSSGKKDTKL